MVNFLEELSKSCGAGIHPLYEKRFTEKKQEIYDGIKEVNSLGWQTYNFDFWDVECEVRQQVRNDIIQQLKLDGFRITVAGKWKRHFVHWGKNLKDKNGPWMRWFIGYKEL